MSEGEEKSTSTVKWISLILAIGVVVALLFVYRSSRQSQISCTNLVVGLVTTTAGAQDCQVLTPGCEPANISKSNKDQVKWTTSNGHNLKIEFEGTKVEPFVGMKRNTSGHWTFGCDGATSSCSSGAIDPQAPENVAIKYWCTMDGVTSIDPHVIIRY